LHECTEDVRGMSIISDADDTFNFGVGGSFIVSTDVVDSLVATVSRISSD
jgi:hypothetical protein